MANSLVSILVPVYNNAAYLRELHARTRSTLQAAGVAYELLLVDDGSRDESWQVITELAAEDSSVKGLRLSRNFGQHAAISAALESARGDRFVLMDADLQDRPELIPRLLDRLVPGGPDIVYTLKVGDPEGLLRRLSSYAFHSFVGSSTRSHAAGNIGTFRAFNRKIATALGSYRERGVVYGPLMHTMGFDVAFENVPRDPRVGSRSSYSFSRRIALAFQSAVSYSTLPQKVLLWTGGLICAASIGYLLVIVVQHLLGGASLPEGLTLLLALVLFMMGAVMMGLGILASYLFLIYREILDRPRYHVRTAVNMESPG